MVRYKTSNVVASDDVCALAIAERIWYHTFTDVSLNIRLHNFLWKYYRFPARVAPYYFLPYAAQAPRWRARHLRWKQLQLPITPQTLRQRGLHGRAPVSVVPIATAGALAGPTDDSHG